MSPKQILDTVKPFLNVEVATMRPDLTLKAAKTNVAVFNIKSTQRALDRYYAMNGKYPDNIIDAGISNIDPWKTPLIYYKKGTSNYVLFSAGPDRIIGTYDDIQIKK
jgi:hypothetical protein